VFLPHLGRSYPSKISDKRHFSCRMICSSLPSVILWSPLSSPWSVEGSKPSFEKAAQTFVRHAVLCLVAIHAVWDLRKQLIGQEHANHHGN
jgi:hypothetical protein